MLFTIGYEGSSLDGYLNRLIKNNVRTLIDLRRNPLSRKYGFSKKTLAETVKKLGIDYVHIPELASPPSGARNSTRRPITTASSRPMKNRSWPRTKPH